MATVQPVDRDRALRLVSVVTALVAVVSLAGVGLVTGVVAAGDPGRRQQSGPAVP